MGDLWFWCHVMRQGHQLGGLLMATREARKGQGHWSQEVKICPRQCSSLEGEVGQSRASRGDLDISPYAAGRSRAVPLCLLTWSQNSKTSVSFLSL